MVALYDGHPPPGSGVWAVSSVRRAAPVRV